MAAIIDHPTDEQRLEAWRIFKAALKAGNLVKPSTCAWCGKAAKKIDGHHPDYARPLMVVWLCASCHKIHHAAYQVERHLVRDGF